MAITLKLPSPKALLLIGCAIVGASTVVFLFVEPTIGLAGFIELLVFYSTVGSIEYTSVPWWYVPLWLALCTCLNVALFSLPAFAIIGVFRRRSPAASFLVLSWMVSYLLAFLAPFMLLAFGLLIGAR